MEPYLFKVPSKSLLISLMCWFAIVGNMWVFLSTSRARVTDNDSLANEQYFCLGLLANLVDILKLVDARSIILGLFILLLPCKMESHW